MPALDFHAPLLGRDGEPCATCADPLAADQRYCLHCGARRGPARLDPVAMARGAWAVEPAGAASPLPAALRPRAGLWAMPSPRIAATAAMAVLAFGIVAGTVAGPRTDTSLASAQTAGPIVLVGPPAAAPEAAAPAAEPAPLPETSAGEPDVAPDTAGTPVETAPAPAEVPVSPAATTPDTTDDTPADTAPAAAAPAAPPVKHVWVVALAGHTFADVAAAPQAMPYLTGTLAPKGLSLPDWEAASAGSLANLVVLASGHRPTDEQKAGCPVYADETCVLPKDVDTLPGQLSAVGKTWRGYVESSEIGSDPPNSCRHPELGQPDPWTAPRPGDAYLTQRNPFVYFHGIVDTPDCGANLAPASRLAPDAQDAESAPNYSLVVPDACHDGRDAPCADGAPAGLAAADAWLKDHLEPLLASKAYADDGLVVVTFDASPDPAKPVGALLLSPHVAAGTTADTPYTHTGLVRTIEDAFSLDHLGKADSDSVKPLGDDIFSVTNRSR